MEPRNGPSIIVSLLIIAIMVLTLTVHASSISGGTDFLAADAYIPFEFRSMSDASDFEAAVTSAPRSDHIGTYYQDPDTRALVLEFFEKLTGRYDVAKAILNVSTARDVPPALAFALAYEESRFDPQAFNRNPSSVDRGLFQLNSSSFPKLKLAEFYDVDINAEQGLAHLSFCLKQGGNVVAALAVYNAGLGRVSKGGTPRRTLDYIFRITGYQDRLEALFEAQVVAKYSKSVFASLAFSPTGYAN